MSEKLTRETFIDPDFVKIATSSLKKYFVLAEKDDESLEEVDLPPSVKETGILPEGYSVDFLFDPATLLSSLAEQGITTVDKLPPGLLENLKGTINNPENLSIVPTSVYEQKLELVQGSK